MKGAHKPKSKIPRKGAKVSGGSGKPKMKKPKMKYQGRTKR